VFQSAQKPLFTVLENSAITDALVTETEQNLRLTFAAKESRRSDNASERILCNPLIPFAFSFPLCDLLICELENQPEYTPSAAFAVENTACYETRKYRSTIEPLQRSLPGITVTSPARFSATARTAALALKYAYQKVVRRQIFARRPYPKKDPNYILTGAKELLECGHEIEVFPSEMETLTARKRNCHECSGWFGGLEIKKPIKKAARDVERGMRQAGESIWWPLAFAMAVLILFGYISKRESARDFTYSAPSDIYRILRRADANHYELRHVHRELGQIKYVRTQRAVFCTSYAPDLSAGQTITFIHYLDLGSCWDISGKDYHYTLETKDGHHPTLAPNCFVNGKNMTECSPNEKEANFPEEN